jgi:vancomycin resistance protein YoaR
LRVEAGSSAVRLRRRRRARARRLLAKRLLALTAVGVVAAGLVGLAFAGSSDRIAEGVQIDGVDVSGLTTGEAIAKLEARSRAVANAPVVFTANGHHWRASPNDLGVHAQWKAAVERAQSEGEGFAPWRGLRRVSIRLLGSDVTPPARVWKHALDYKVQRMSAAVGTAHRNAAIVLRGLHPRVVPGRTGLALDKQLASQAIVGALTSFERGGVVKLPVAVDSPRVTAAELAPVADQVRTALSGRIRMSLGTSSWWLPPGQLASLLSLPHDGSSELAIGGKGANGYFKRLGHGIGRPPRDASFSVTPGDDRVRVIPARPGRVIDVPKTERSILAAALATSDRTARVAVTTRAANRSTAEARSMGITTRIAGYETIYGGEANRIHNVQLVARLIDRKLVAPGATFSFNQATGARTASKGFLEAPVIINGELTTGLGGGVCQVSTTVFNAAYEAGLKITARTNHALYISHYPQGRDATVNYPDTDLRFVNDTPHWLLLRTFVGSSSLVVELYGAPIHRRVVTQTRPLLETGPVPVKRTPDPALFRGVRVVDEYGQPPRSTSVRRLVYLPSGKLLYDNTWYSSYRGEPSVVRFGTRQKQPKKGPSGPSGPTGPTGADGVIPQS